jgi:signal transduction histidine kinase/HAMP domain-containing protein
MKTLAAGTYASRERRPPTPAAAGSAATAAPTGLGGWLHRTPVAAKLAAVTLSFVVIIGTAMVVMGMALRIANGVRAYVAGEGFWSRAQKDAVLALERYAHSGAESDFRSYERALLVILGDRTARLELEKRSYDYRVVSLGFQQGGNSPDDVPDLIFLFRHLGHVSYLREAIACWVEGDALIDRLMAEATALREAVRAQDAAGIDRALAAVRATNDALTILELRFSATLADGARWANRALKAGGMAITLVLLVAGVLLSRLIAGQLRTGIAELQRGTARVSVGDFSQPIAVKTNDELGELARAFNGMIEQRRAAAEALEERMRFELLITRLSSHLTTITSSVDAAINRALGDVGRFVGVDRSYVFMFNETHELVTCTHEWCAEGIEPQIARLQDLRVSDFPWVEPKLERGEIIHVPRVAELPPEAAAEKREWEAESIRSLLLIPMRTGEVVRGYVGFDTVRRETDWPQESNDVLRIFGELVVNTMTRVQAEQTLRERNQSLAAAVRELQRSNAELEEYAYIASHDLTAPLRGINGFIHLLQRKLADRLDTQSAEYLRLCLHSVDHMQSLVEGLLTLSRVGKGGAPGEPTDCEAVLKEVEKQLAPLIAERGAVIAHGPLPTVVATRMDVHQLLQNLISNAIKFQPGPSPQVDITAERDGPFWRFAVRDHGIGIRPEHQQRIFQIFQRLHTTDEFEGSGIGLAICRKIVQRHAGRIWVESEDGKGSTFYFTLRA